MRLLMAVPFMFFCSCTFNLSPPLNYDDQIVVADLVLQNFAPEECAYNPRAIKYVCEDGQAEVLNEDLIIIRQKLISYAGEYTKDEAGSLVIEELFRCSSAKKGFMSCGAKLPRQIISKAGFEYRGEKDKLYLYANK